MTRTHAITAVIMFCALTAGLRAGSPYAIVPVPAKYTANLPFTMPAVALPAIPERTMNVLDFGAVRDGHTMNTEAFAKAITACAAAGGGTVVVPAGEYLTGPIRFESRINLHVERGALVIFSKRFEDYPLVPFPTAKSKNFGCTPPIWGVGLEDVAITGAGVFDGSGDAWRPMKKEKYTAKEWKQITSSGGVVSADGAVWYPSEAAMNGEEYLKELKRTNKKPAAADFARAKEFLRPKMVEFYGCSRLLLDGPTFRNSPHFAVRPSQSENIVIRNVTIQNPWNAQNGDGLDLTSVHNVIVYNTVVDCGDDALCIKPGLYDASTKWTAACENIVIEDCTVYRGHGGFVIGSETYGGARNIMARNLTMIGTDVGLRFKSAREKGDLIEKIYIDGVVMKDIQAEAILFDTYYASGSAEKNAVSRDASREAEPVNDRTPRFDGFTISNIVCSGAERAMLFLGLPEMPIRNISISNATFSAAKGGLLVDAEGITLTNVTVTPASGPVYVMNEAKNVTITGAKVPANTAVFVTVDGEGSTGIVIEKTNLTGVTTPVDVNKNAKPGAVTVKP